MKNNDGLEILYMDETVKIKIQNAPQTLQVYIPQEGDGLEWTYAIIASKTGLQKRPSFILRKREKWNWETIRVCHTLGFLLRTIGVKVPPDLEDIWLGKLLMNEMIKDAK